MCNADGGLIKAMLKTFGRGLRIIVGLLCIIVGIPLYVLPVPLGLLCICTGIALLACKTAAYARGIEWLQRRRPGVYKRLRPMLDRCRRAA
jgi:hypothetical protein